ncbi:MAG TPA: hypothetical protein VG345_06755 [Bryobacteraceae bacterium]|jgi:hypothetical protein|nr:hypothetical protein [Bryobacteraceae bacterium]
MRRTIQVYLIVAACAAAQTTINGSRVVSGSWDASNAASSKPAKTGSSLPPTCGTGEQFFLTSAPAGNNLYLCAAVNTWSPASAPVAAQTANQVFAGPASGAAGAPGFRTLAKADLPATAVYTDQSNTFTAGTQDLRGAGATLPARMGSSLPSTCMQGELFILSTALPGKNLNLCYATNNWVQIGAGAGSGGANGGPVASAGACNLGASGSTYFPTDSPYEIWCDGTAWRYRLSGVSVTPADDSQFVWDVQNGGSVSISGGTTSTVGDVYMTAPAGPSGAFAPSMRAVTNPYGRVWTLTVVLGATPTINLNGSEFGGFGIYFRNGATGDSYSRNTGSLRFDYSGNDGLGQFSFQAADSSNSMYAMGNLQGVNSYNQVSLAGPVWLRLHADGTNVIAQISSDLGQNWRTIGVLPISTVTGPSGQIGQIGWYVTPNNNVFPMTASLLNWNLINQ